MIGAKRRKRIGAALLAAALVVTQLPAMAMAENIVPEDGSIASFAALDSDVAEQTVPVGTAYEDLNLPDTVAAKVCHVTEDAVIPDEDDAEEENSDSSITTPSDAGESVSGNGAGHKTDSGKTVMTVATTEEEIPVIWDSAPAYDGGMVGKYVFTAEAAGYILSDGAAWPAITVTVGTETPSAPEDAGTITVTAFDELAEAVKYAPLQTTWDGLGLPATLGASGYAVTDDTEPAPEPEAISIKGVTWEVFEKNGSPAAYEEGRTSPCIYWLRAVLPEGYTLDEGAALPEIELRYGMALRAGPATGDFTVTGGTPGDDYDYNSGTHILTIKGGAVLTISGTTTQDSIVVANGAENVKLTLAGVNIQFSDGAFPTSGTCAFDMAGAEVELTLAGGSDNILKSGYNRAGLEAPATSTLTIGGTGKLTATGGDHGAGIGGGSGGTIIINGGTVEATGGSSGAGIGGGFGGSGGSITINGGDVKATGGGGGAGIGGGFGSDGSDGGTITIRGGNVEAKGGSGGAGIGGGSGSGGSGGDGGDITIDGGTVKATGGNGGAGIGGGYGHNGGSGGTISIYGSAQVEAAGGEGAGIGGGGSKNNSGGDGGIIRIYGSAQVIATGGTSIGGTSIGGAGIGGGGVSVGGVGGGGGDIQIYENATVTAEGPNSTGIGGGSGNNGGSGGDIQIYGNVTVTAKGGYGAGIGGCNGFTGGAGGDIAIRDNAVVFATGSYDADHIGGGYGISGGSVTDHGTVTRGGVIFEDAAGKVYGDVTLPGDLTIPGGSTLTNDYTLTNPDGATLTNNGTIDGSGTLTGGGTFTGTGTYTTKVTRAIAPPTPKSSTQTSVTLNAVTPTGDGTVEYARSDTNTTPTGGWQTVPTFDGLAVGKTYYFFSRVTGSTIYMDVTSDGAAITTASVNPVYSIRADTAALNFGAITVGDTPPAEQTVTVENTGNQDVTLTPPTATGASYDVGALSQTALASGEQATFTVRPQAGLAVGSHNETLTINGYPSGSATVSLSFTVNARPSGSGGGGGGGGGGGSSSHYIITAPEPPKPDNPVLAVIELPVSVTEGKPATGAADDGRTSAALAEAGRDAKAKTNGIAVQYDAKTSLTYDGFSIVMQRATLDRLVAAKVKYVTLNTGIVDMTFDLAALGEIQKQATGDITLTAARETGLAGDALAAVGSRPAYRLSVGYTGADGKAATVTSFGAGRAAVGLAYQPAATEQTGGLYLVYSADGKGAEWLYQSSYDKNSGNVIGSVGHFSVYGVGYQTAPTFTDTVNHWAKADIDFVVSRGLFSGTSETTFSPDSTITRGMFVTALGRLAGIDPAAYPSSRFTDVPATAYYAPYVEWAASKGIVSGTGESSFSPDAAITREQMALIMRQYAVKLGYTLPVAREAVTFTDENQITGSMKDAVQAIQQAGIMSGKGNNRFGPKDAATRAEAAVVLRRFVEVVIDRDTAGGWGQNDAGRWLYYLDGKPVTGWKQIEGKWYYFDAAGLMEYGGWKQIGGKWYYFYPDGSMAADTKIDGYEIGPDGVRKEEN